MNFIRLLDFVNIIVNTALAKYLCRFHVWFISWTYLHASVKLDKRKSKKLTILNFFAKWENLDPKMIISRTFFLLCN